MEGTLLVTPEELMSAASQFSAKAAQVQALHNDMLVKVNSLSGSWTGNASDAYRQKFQSLQESMNKINRMIMEHSTDLNAMAETYSQAESTASNAANDLPLSNLE